ncbi:MAG TPA: phosphatidylglycerophosphatase A [Kofleriaceae bacterium]|nr:phosphatidylglycerophosphatase A [Kofleriaceae bacterium]
MEPTHTRANRALDRVAVAVATGAGVGYAPVAPGTFGTLLAVPIAWSVSALPQWGYLALCAAVTILAVWAAGRADRVFGEHDAGRIVIDEVAGFLCAMVPVSRADWTVLAAGFVLFRVADIAKPPPARWIDRRLQGGAGVVLDDVVAGAYAAVALWALVQGGWLASLFG